MAVIGTYYTIGDRRVGGAGSRAGEGGVSCVLFISWHQQEEGTNEYTRSDEKWTIFSQQQQTSNAAAVRSASSTSTPAPAGFSVVGWWGVLGARGRSAQRPLVPHISGVGLVAGFRRDGHGAYVVLSLLVSTRARVHMIHAAAAHAVFRCSVALYLRCVRTKTTMWHETSQHIYQIQSATHWHDVRQQYRKQIRVHLPSEMLLYPRQGDNAGPPPVENAPHRLLGAMT